MRISQRAHFRVSASARQLAGKIGMASELPASLKSLALRNAIQVRNTNFGSDAEQLSSSGSYGQSHREGTTPECSWKKVMLD
jgi:hypothetical protein